MEKGIQVRLTTDLTKYNSLLVPGVEGYTVGNMGMWSRGSARFISVRLPNITTIDILWKSLEIIDEEYLKKASERESELLEELKSASHVTKFVGPRGGFRYLTYSYTDKNGISVNASNGFKNDSERLIKIFESYGMKIETKII